MVFDLVCKGVLLCSQHCAGRFSLGSLNLAPSLSTNQGQIQETFCSKTISALVKDSTQKSFPQIHQIFPIVPPLIKANYQPTYPARLKEQAPIGQTQPQQPPRPHLLTDAAKGQHLPNITTKHYHAMEMLHVLAPGSSLRSSTEMFHLP